MNLAEWLKQPGNTQEKLGAMLTPPVTQGAIGHFMRKRVPAERVLQIERATEGAVTRYEMRPDLYPIEEAA